ncbi:hypothetical protein BCL79_1883 [Stenotrophomonas rhizophila]|uniref:Uncharacterized protein n=1 Tax=Stenotrophomonas rhizophila TaxID=216778 RepID=A0A498CI48_9GAMM|nr:hypothetical protein [Stenotrophomonas rhizophila]RLK57477.1 hypothetical protein BCL79_1883 [Stenotrophomonas rhizophila]
MTTEKPAAPLSTSDGARCYIAHFFAREMRRHDFTTYIATELAADFACALAQYLAATGKQPVGEVQGDARAKWLEVRGLAAGIVKNLEAFAASPHKAAWCGALDDSLSFADQIEKDAAAALAARQPVRIYGCCAQPEGELHTAECPNMRHLAARQPGAQPPVGQVRTRVDGGFIAELFPGVADRVSNMAPLYVAAPAQGIDLGPFRTQVAELLRMEFDLEVADPEDHRHDDGASEAERIASKIAALIDQRDAAPGVGNG